MKLVFASANNSKIAEIAALLVGHVQLLGLRDLGIEEDIPEPGVTIKENSFLKAAYVLDFMQRHKLEIAPVFADDSGLEVAALQGAPGVFSARYAGTPKSDEANNKKLIQEMKPFANRQARFVTVITLIMNGQTHYFEGTVEGSIIDTPKGVTGFGYDPLFVPSGYTHTFAELGADIKNTISHRAKAVGLLIDFLGKQI